MFATTNVMSKAIWCPRRGRLRPRLTFNCRGHHISGCKRVLRRQMYLKLAKNHFYVINSSEFYSTFLNENELKLTWIWRERVSTESYLWIYTISLFIFHPKCELVYLNILHICCPACDAQPVMHRYLKREIATTCVFKKVTPIFSKFLLRPVKFMTEEVKSTTVQRNEDP